MVYPRMLIRIIILIIYYLIFTSGVRMDVKILLNINY